MPTEVVKDIGDDKVEDTSPAEDTENSVHVRIPSVEDYAQQELYLNVGQIEDPHLVVFGIEAKALLTRCGPRCSRKVLTLLVRR